MVSLLVAPVTLVSVLSAWVVFQNRKLVGDKDLNALVRDGDECMGQCIARMLKEERHVASEWWKPPSTNDPIAHVRWYASLVIHMNSHTSKPFLLPAPSSLVCRRSSVSLDTFVSDIVGHVILAYTTASGCACAQAHIIRLTCGYLLPDSELDVRTAFFSGYVAHRVCTHPRAVVARETTTWMQWLVDDAVDQHSTDILVHDVADMFRTEMSRAVDMVGKLAYTINIASAYVGSDAGAAGYCVCTCAVAFLAVIGSTIHGHTHLLRLSTR